MNGDAGRDDRRRGGKGSDDNASENASRSHTKRGGKRGINGSSSGHHGEDGKRRRMG